MKPANIKITSDGRVKLLDFGIAKLVVGEAASDDFTRLPTVTVDRTREGVLLGTAAYMSPEQARGQAADKRTDIWAIGVLKDRVTHELTAPGGGPIQVAPVVPLEELTNEELDLLERIYAKAEPKCPPAKG